MLLSELPKEDVGFGEHAGTGRRRRLRQWLRHERLTVAMAFSRAYHHTLSRLTHTRKWWKPNSTQPQGDRRRRGLRSTTPYVDRRQQQRMTSPIASRSVSWSRSSRCQKFGFLEDVLEVAQIIFLKRTKKPIMEHIVFDVPEPQIMDEIVDMFDDLMPYVVEIAQVVQIKKDVTECIV